MKIAFIGQPFDAVLPPHQNSIGIWTNQVANRLTGFDEIIIYSRSNRGPKIIQTGKKITYKFISSAPSRLWYKLEKWISPLFSIRNPYFCNPFYYPEYITQVALDLRKQKCDIVHVFNFPQFASIIRSLNPNPKIVLHMHCEWLNQLDKNMLDRHLRNVDLVLGCSEYISEKARRRFPQMAQRFRTVVNGVDVDSFHTDRQYQPEEKKKILFVGRISPEKGIHTLISALTLVANQIPDIQLEIVGPPGVLPYEYVVGLSDDPGVKDLAVFYQGSAKGADYPAKLAAMVHPSLVDSVHFRGFIPQAEIVHYYKEASLLVNPSLSEAFGMSLVEAMASQVPVVATKVGGMTEILRGSEAGILVQPDDPTALADAILSLLNNAPLREKYGGNGQKHAQEQYAWERVAETLWANYQQLLQPNHGKSDA